MSSFLQKHWRRFWRSGPSTFYSFIWWAIFGAILAMITAVALAVWHHWYLAIPFIAVAVAAFLASLIVSRYLPQPPSALPQEAVSAHLAAEPIRGDPIAVPIQQVASKKPPAGIPARLIPEGSIINALSGLPASDPEAQKAAENLVANGASSDAMAKFTREDFQKV